LEFFPSFEKKGAEFNQNMPEDPVTNTPQSKSAERKNLCHTNYEKSQFMWKKVFSLCGLTTESSDN